VCKLHVQQVRYALFVRLLIRIGLAYERTLAIRGWLEPAIGASTKTGAQVFDSTTLRLQSLGSLTGLEVSATKAGEAPFIEAGFTTLERAENGKYYIEGVLAHEIGHLLGLEHDADTTSLMYNFKTPQQSKWNLQLNASLRNRLSPCVFD